MRQSSIEAWKSCEKLALAVARRICASRGLLHTVDEANGVARYALLKAVRHHDASRSALSTYAYRVVSNSVNHWLNDAYRRVDFRDALPESLDTHMPTSSQLRMSELTALLSEEAQKAVRTILKADLPEHYRARLLRPAARRTLKDAGFDVEVVWSELTQAVTLVYS